MNLYIMKKISEELKNNILNLLDKQLSTNQIEKETEISSSTIS